jgi:hypothetical protein
LQQTDGYQMPGTPALGRKDLGVVPQAFSCSLCCALGVWLMYCFQSPSQGGGDLPFIRPEEQDHFKKLLEEVDESTLSKEEANERLIMTLLLKVDCAKLHVDFPSLTAPMYVQVKNGTPPQRKSALRQLTDKARSFGAGPLFNQVSALSLFLCFFA